MSYKRSRERRRRLKKLCEESYSFVSGAWYDEKKKTYRKMESSKESARKKYLRKVSNRKVRRSKDVPNGNKYRRFFDYWWELY